MKMLIGSGFAELLDKKKINLQGINVGNDLKTHKSINSKNFFYKLKKEKINVPPWSISNPNEKNWLKKDFKSFGGNLVKKSKRNEKSNASEYFQKIIYGEHLSVQFYSNKTKVKILCICEQFFRELNNHPFIIDGLITKKTKKKNYLEILDICEKINRIYKLNGINSLDLILEKKTNDLYVIELNARPGLSTHILARKNLNIFKDSLPKRKYKKGIYYYGTKIIYCKNKIIVDKNNLKKINDISCSKNFSELPKYGQIIDVNEPICLVHAKSKKKQKLQENLEKIAYKFLKHLN